MDCQIVCKYKVKASIQGQKKETVVKQTQMDLDFWGLRLRLLWVARVCVNTQ